MRTPSLKEISEDIHYLRTAKIRNLKQPYDGLTMHCKQVELNGSVVCYRKYRYCVLPDEWTYCGLFKKSDSDHIT